MIKFPHNALDGVKSKWQKTAGNFRPELRSARITSTFSAVMHGYRVMTSRAGYWDRGTFRVRGARGFMPLYPGSEIFISSNRFGGGELIIPARVVRIAKKTVGQMLQEYDDYAYLWSIAQGWAEDYLKDNPSVLNKYDVLFVAYDNGPAIRTQEYMKAAIRRLYDIFNEIKIQS